MSTTSDSADSEDDDESSSSIIGSAANLVGEFSERSTETVSDEDLSSGINLTVFLCARELKPPYDCGVDEFISPLIENGVSLVSYFFIRTEDASPSRTILAFVVVFFRSGGDYPPIADDCTVSSSSVAIVVPFP